MHALHNHKLNALQHKDGSALQSGADMLCEVPRIAIIKAFYK
jgi:hypothetical protein